MAFKTDDSLLHWPNRFLAFSLPFFFLMARSTSPVLPEGLFKNDTGSITDKKTGVVFPQMLNGHQLQTDRFVSGREVTTTYSHGGYGGRWLPYIQAAAVEVADRYEPQSDLERRAKSLGIEKAEISNIKLNVGDKTLTTWFLRGYRLMEPNKEKILFAEKEPQWVYVFTAQKDSLLLEILGICSEKEDQYFKWDVKKTFEEFVTSNLNIM